MGKTNFHTREIPRSGSKAEDGEKEKKKRKIKKEEERRRANNGDNNGQATHGVRKPPGPKKSFLLQRRLGLTLCIRYECLVKSKQII